MLAVDEEHLKPSDWSQDRSRGSINLLQSEEGRFPTRSTGPGFGEVEQRPPGAREDQTLHLQEWTLRRILETHKVNLQKWREARKASLSGAKASLPAAVPGSSGTSGVQTSDSVQAHLLGNHLNPEPETPGKQRQLLSNALILLKESSRR